jgi:hypothetical protein
MVTPANIAHSHAESQQLGAGRADTSSRNGVTSLLLTVLYTGV